MAPVHPFEKCTSCSNKIPITISAFIALVRGIKPVRYPLSTTKQYYKSGHQIKSPEMKTKRWTQSVLMPSVPKAYQQRSISASSSISRSPTPWSVIDKAWGKLASTPQPSKRSWNWRSQTRSSVLSKDRCTFQVYLKFWDNSFYSITLLPPKRTGA